MSWLLELYRTYEANSDDIGEVQKRFNGTEYTLLPTGHTTQNAHIEVNITKDGEWHSARVIPKDEANTTIPTTEDSASRSGKKVAPYPLHDKLSYVAGDFSEYEGNAKAEQFDKYITNLETWKDSPHGHWKIKSIYNYLRNERLITDLVEENILFLDSDGKLLNKWDSEKGEKPEIFKVLVGEPESLFVKFNVHSPNEILTPVWQDKDVFTSFINFYKDQLLDDDYCYILGEILPKTERHANKIRHAADKAKLISDNDTSGFTYRGRFEKSFEAASISYEASQKAHNALKWLIRKQGKTIDGRVFLVWENSGQEVIEPSADSYDVFHSDSIPDKTTFTNTEFAHAFSKAIDGYKSNLEHGRNINIMVMDSATTGRLAVLYYRIMDVDSYLERIKTWHSSCIWLHMYKRDGNKNRISYLGAPSARDIAFAAYGPEVNDQVTKGLVERMLPCVVDGRRIPRDVIRSAFYRASNPVGMEKWEWEKTLSITCSLINKEEGYSVRLDETNQDRDYLFGRLLAAADVLERRALSNEEQRATNAIRLMNSFSKHPERTWKTIQESIQPYQAKLGKKANDLNKLIDDIGSQIDIKDFNNKPLSGKYLLGFYSQRYELYQKKSQNPEEEMINE
ncbi:type I-C CRISPR-associated protein Cas8c/Csd1 [Salisediminibacterium halotolerans]|uniref:CRISPR-associated protein Csd1 n=1 Tax=Salisediminibacterium halotolerans TaxID=517425 RepID=A0A1H9T675_9BACI|nr:type I-C CRISPR-associated protein Cas8c/Csd1 [Salisediminibacterium haloalkalitolerans]SER92646.1 CRISPR-associated protein Csd1 [Salisediminibacterium haloalkalitolerans]